MSATIPVSVSGSRPLSNDLWQQYKHFWKPLSVPAKTLLLKEGEVSRKAYFIDQGSLRIWFNSQGKDVSFQFFFEGEGVSSFESFFKSLPSHFNIETLEPSRLYYLHKDDYEQMVAEAPIIKDVILEAAIDRMANYTQHFLSAIKDTPQERYRKLLEERPHILQRVPLQYIASYLGITAVSLSRIRNKMQ